MTPFPDPFANLHAALQRHAAQTAAFRDAWDKATAPAREAMEQITDSMRQVAAQVEEVTRPLREVAESISVTISVPAAGAVASAGKAVLRAARASLERARRAAPALRRAARAALAALGLTARPVVVRVVAPPRERARPPGEQVPALSLMPSLSLAAHAPPARALTGMAARAA